ncbi:hypothetical protein IscW_ISCW008273 [Ixodes scapularis]|uniref:Uncharacterized protein n=1 Tax=Ixodes scapularis TaxID=6945 RepID=B7PS48_IXOSC|nr:hypothetical protein IscW_ISCW008273 [Ixodes scapularis]|eukprot:XP_002401943.1 hypothetical protein IscW_ISCW008273 [Ixodes scapularis]
MHTPRSPAEAPSIFHSGIPTTQWKASTNQIVATQTVSAGTPDKINKRGVEDKPVSKTLFSLSALITGMISDTRRAAETHAPAPWRSVEKAA